MYWKVVNVTENSRSNNIACIPGSSKAFLGYFSLGMLRSPPI